MRSIVRAICISRIFDIRDLRSGQFRDLPMLTRAVAGGGGQLTAPPPFFCDNSRTAARSAAKFSVPFRLFIAHVV